MKAEKDTAVLYVHGKGGSAAEAEHYRALFPQAEVYGFDYRVETPWDAKEEFSARAAELRATYSRVLLVANSIGAYFSMNAGLAKMVEKAWLISPIVNMERLILDMIAWAGTTEAELEARETIPTNFGETLSWTYLQYVRAHPVEWNVPTEILCGSADTLQSIDTIRAFAGRWRAGVTVLQGGEHWFHTERQMRFLDEWIRATGAEAAEFLRNPLTEA